jgi:membrane fusion protein, multidrug efflux system
VSYSIYSPQSLLLAGLLMLPTAAAYSAGPPGGMPPMPVEAQPVTVGEIVRSAETVGNLLGYEAVVLRPQIQGKVEKILFEEGQPVTAGQPMVQLDDDQYKAELDEAVANRNLSDANYRRTKKLIKRKVASDTDRDKAYAELQANKARVALKKEALSKTVLASPFDGIAGLRSVSVGDVITPGQALLEVVDVDPIKVDFRVPEKYVGEVQSGQQITISVDAFPDEKFQGEVYAVAPLIDSNGRNLQMRATVPNADHRLLPGMFARVELALKKYENAISVPEEAIVPMGDKQLVYRIKDGKAEMVPVKLGIRYQAKVQVVEGLEPGDVVITAGQIKVRPGAPVNPINLKPANTEAPL